MQKTKRRYFGRPSKYGEVYKTLTHAQRNSYLSYVYQRNKFNEPILSVEEYMNKVYTPRIKEVDRYSEILKEYGEEEVKVYKSFSSYHRKLYWNCKERIKPSLYMIRYLRTQEKKISKVNSESEIARVLNCEVEFVRETIKKFITLFKERVTLDDCKEYLNAFDRMSYKKGYAWA